MTAGPFNTESINLLTGERYTVPEVLDDKLGIDAFLAGHPGKQVVVIQGLGFVGAAMALVVANSLTEEYAVIGIDLPSAGSLWKIRSINQGTFPIVADDPKIQQFYQQALQKKNLYATFDPYAYSKADVIVIDINLDVSKGPENGNETYEFDVDLTPFRKAVRSIGENCKTGALILVETTVPPGTCQQIVHPMLVQCLRERGLPSENLKTGHSYERVMPGAKYIDSIQNFYRVYSGIDEPSALATEMFLRTIIHTDEYPLTRLANTTATEMAKVLENSFRAMNIAFMVEWSRFAEEAGVNMYEVVGAIRMRPTHKNIMLPGLGVGGYCLTKDPLLASWARKNLFNSVEGLSQSVVGVRINDRMPKYAFAYLKTHYESELRDKKVLLLGVSYLNDVGDTRFTPVESFYDQLVEAGCDIRLHDPHVSYWQERQLQVGQDIESLLSDRYDVIVITTGHKDYKKNSRLMARLLEMDRLFIYDTIGALTGDEIKALQVKHNLKVLGRGDI